MDIQSVLMKYARGTLDLNSIPDIILKKINFNIEKQLRLHAASKNKNAIPHIKEMLVIKSLIDKNLIMKGTRSC